jgi:hypothetical protein
MQIYLIESTQIEAFNDKLKTSNTLVVLPVIDLEMGKRVAALAASRAGVDATVLVVNDTMRMRLVKIHNQVFKCSQSPYYAYLAQDVFVGSQWLALGVDAFKNSGAGLLAFNDGKWQGQLASFGHVCRDWASQVYGGALFFESYNSHYADTELTLVARDQDRFAYDANAVALEVDWNQDQAPTHAQDKALFKTRAQTGFGERLQSAQLRGMFS